MNKLDELFQDVQAYRSSTEFKQYMEFCAHFRLLGAYNSMLVRTQRDGVRYVLTPSQWKKYNRRPVANSRPLVILMPFGPVDFVFDVSDTEHIPGLPEVEYEKELDMMSNPFKAEGKVVTQEYLVMQENLKMLGIKLDLNLFSGSTLAAQIKREDGVELETIKYHGKSLGLYFPYHFRISINSNAPDAEQFASLCHELGHYFCNHMQPPTPDWWEPRDITQQQEEFEAESVAWLVCQRHGIDNVSTERYLAGYLDKCEKVPQVAVGTIMSAVDQIERLFGKMNLSASPLYKFDDEFYRQVTGKRRVNNGRRR